MGRRRFSNRSLLLLFLAGAVLLAQTSGPVANGPLPGPFPLFPADNWWNLDVSSAPVDPGSAGYIGFIGTTRALHPDFGGDASSTGPDIYGMPYAVVGGAQAKKSVHFVYSSESDGVNHTTNQSFAFYPIPDEAITQPKWIEDGYPGNVDRRAISDRHLLIVDRDNRYLYELYNVFWDGAQWQAGSGAFFDMNRNDRRPDGWTSADAAGLAILPGLVRYDEVYGSAEIGHAFRFTVRATNGYVYPASHRAGSTTGALPMGARLRLKASKDISRFPPDAQKIFRAMKKYGLIVADNGSDMLLGVWKNVVAQAASARAARTQFENGFGDALITYEQEALYDKSRGKLTSEIVYPRSTVYSEHTLVRIDRNIPRRDRELVDAFVQFLWSDRAQAAFSRYGFRSVDEERNAGLTKIEDGFGIADFGGWAKAKKEIVDGVWKGRVLKELGK